MKVYPVRNPLSGEEIVAVQPDMKPVVEAGWQRRLNLYAGRTLSHSALIAEQKARAARLALLSEAVTPGLVEGLEIGLETAGQDRFVHLAPGLGVTAGGEDVRVLQPLRLAVTDLRAFAPVSVLDGQGAPPQGPLAPRKLGGSLGELAADGVTFTQPLVLVLQPVLGERIGELDTADPCECDPRNEAFEDQQIVDGCRLIAYVWPDEWLPLPGGTSRWRNALAWAVFAREAEVRGEGGVLPWEEEGVAVGLLAQDPVALTWFLDRFSVARPGGEPPPRSSLFADRGGVPLWQARIQQFAEHLAQLPQSELGDPVSHFRFLPPVGLLPKDAAVFARPPAGAAENGGVQGFFPAEFKVVASPVPVDELEPAFQASASLDPFDIVNVGADGDEVHLLVPVPLAVYDPDLLVEEVVSPEFQEAIDEITGRRGDWRFRRDDLREKVATLNRGLAGNKAPDPFPADLDADPDELPGTAPAPPEDAYGTTGSPGAFEVPAIAALEAEFQSGPFQMLKDELFNAADPAINLIRAKGLVRFTADLQAKLDRADDRVDLGFLEVQTSMYKIRQFMLGNLAGTRLATSPTLAAISQGESALTTRWDLQGLLDQLKKPLDDDPERHSLAVGAQALAVGGGGGMPDWELNLPVAPAIGIKRRFKPAVIASSGTRTNVAATKMEVIEQSPLIGRPMVFRSVAISERLKDSAAVEARQAAIASKHRVVSTFRLDPELFGMVQGLPVPGVKKDLNDPNKTDVWNFDEITPVILQNIGKGLYDPVPQNGDEGAFFSAAVRALDDGAAILRVVEGRLQFYRAAIDRCRDALDELSPAGTDAQTRLDFLEKKLAEARHDLAVAKALLEEEKKRVEAVNFRRQDVLETQVRFLAFQRPRIADLLVDTPVRSLDPAPLQDPLPACRARHIEPPPELRTFVNLLREAPLRWFHRLPPLLQSLDRLDILHNTLLGAKARAGIFLASDALKATKIEAGARPARATALTLNAQREVMSRRRTETSQLDLSGLGQQSWKGALDIARRTLSIGDLLDVPHGRSQVAQLSAQELEQITQVAACLYASFGDVLPALRLDWVERLSEFDDDADLRRLSSLPRWGEVDPLNRRDLQGMVDWLFQRIDLTEPEAVATISDLVRVALLLAGHAPVDRIIAAAVAEATTVKQGGSVRIKVDHSQVRIGMHVLLFSGSQTVARGVLEDVGQGTAMARVVDAYQETIKLTQDARVQITEPVPTRTFGAYTVRAAP